MGRRSSAPSTAIRSRSISPTTRSSCACRDRSTMRPSPSGISWRRRHAASAARHPSTRSRCACDPLPDGPVVSRTVILALPGSAAGGPARLRRDRRPARGRPVLAGRRAHRHPRGRGSAQRAGQGDRLAGAGRGAAAQRTDPDGVAAGSASRSSRRRRSPGSPSSPRCRRRRTWRSRRPSGWTRRSSASSATTGSTCIATTVGSTCAISPAGAERPV